VKLSVRKPFKAGKGPPERIRGTMPRAHSGIRTSPVLNNQTTKFHRTQSSFRVLKEVLP
jgi:hypothetical protein